jgi:Protein of unknown function (DUF3109)
VDEKFLHIDDVLVNRMVTETPFHCDLSKCKGACCTFESEYGAPLKYEEIKAIEAICDETLPYLSEKHRNVIKNEGFYELKGNEYLTKSINNKDCVFVYYENDIAKCSLEKAFFDGKTNFRKPLSCHLFPIRVSDFGGDVLRFEKYEHCQPAIEKGKSENITISEFCEDSLIRLYGKKWYSKLKEASGR